MKSSQIVIVTAMLLAAACAGIVLMDEESDAVAVGDITAVSYTDGKISSSAVVGEDASTVYIANPAGSEDGDAVIGNLTDYENIDYWVSTSGTQYAPGTTIAVATINEADVVNGVFTLTAHYKATDITVVVGDKEYSVDPKGDAPSQTFAWPAEVGDVDPVKEGFKFLGWTVNGEMKSETEYYAYADLVTDGNITYSGHAIGDVIEAAFQKLYDVYWSIDGTVTASGDNISFNAPAAPVKDNYTFMGWAIDGKTVITYNSGLVVSDPEDETYNTFAGLGYRYVGDFDLSDITADTTLTAVFSADLVTVTYMIGDEVYDTIEVRYGGTASNIAYPDGYGAWAIMVTPEVVNEDGTITPAVYEAFDFATPITEELVLYAIESAPDESIYATFNIEGTIYGPYKVTDRFSIPQTDREGYDFLGWTIQGGDGTLLTSAQVQNYQYTEDVTFVANYVAVEPPAPEEPDFFETTAGQAVLVIIVFAIIAFVACIVMNYGGLRDKLTSVKIVRVKKD